MARQATLELLADASKMRSTLAAAGGDADKFGSKFGGIGKAIGGVLAGGAILKFGSDSVAAFTESAQAQSKLELALKNNSATVGVHADAFAKLNTQLAKHTLVDDDVIAATEAQMVTFGASKGQIESMIPTVLDFAAKMGIDAPEAADLFDKASLGSAKALKALGIEGYKPTGDKANDLANIQGLLHDKVKGAAQAQLDAAGPGAKIKKSMDELQESIGGLLVPALQKATEWGTKIIDWLTHLSAPMKIALGVVGGLAIAIWAVNAATTAWSAITGAFTVIQGALNAVMAMNPIVLVALAVGGLVLALYEAYQHCEAFRNIVDAVFGWIGGFVKGAIGLVTDAVTGVWNWVKNNWPLLLEILTGPIGLAVGQIIQHWDTIKNAFTAVKDWIFARIGDIAGFFTALPGQLAGAAGDLFAFVRDKIVAARDWLHDRIWEVIDYFVQLPRRIVTGAGNIFGFLKDAITDARNWIHDKIWEIVDFILGIPNRIANIGKDILAKIIPDLPGKGIIEGVISHIPGFAAGGVVPGPLGAPMLAMVHGGETITPAGRGGGGGGGVTINVSSLDPRGAADAVMSAIREYEQRSGTSWRN